MTFYSPISLKLLREKCPEEFWPEFQNKFGDKELVVLDKKQMRIYSHWHAVAEVLMTPFDYEEFHKKIGVVSGMKTNEELIDIFIDIYKIGKLSIVDKIVQQVYK
jgi:hypothetical protein